MSNPHFRLSASDARLVAEQFGTPLYVYDRKTIHDLADSVLNFPAPFGLTARYAMKACPSRAILQILAKKGVRIDASSGFEAERAMQAGIPAHHIQLTAQEIPSNLAEILAQGVLFNACSLHQLSSYVKLRPNSEVSIRVNPGLGSGHTNRTNTGGPASSFGIWHEKVEEALDVARAADVRISGLHSHIGAGTDPDVWVHCADLTLAIAERLPHITRLSLGGGFKIARMQGEKTADLLEIGKKVAERIRKFKELQGVALHFEVEPGTYLMGNTATLLSSVADVVDTGPSGYRFIKLNAGMTEILRPSMYGAQHEIEVVPWNLSQKESDNFIVVGHCCESGDILTPKAGDPESLHPRTLLTPEIGDLVLVHGAGAYCSSMATINYNSFPRAAEVLRDLDGSFKLIRKREKFENMFEDEIGLAAISV